MKIYHYTSTDGLLGILNKKMLWATNFEYLNDNSEYIFAKEIIQKVISELTDPNVIKHKDTFLICLDQIYQIYDIYTCSFSKKPDILSQWRGYCPEEGGFCIGFDKGLLNKNNQFPLFECIYDYKQQKQQIEKVAIEFCYNIEKIILGTKLKFSSEWESIFPHMDIKPYTNKPLNNPLDLEKNHIVVKYELAQLSAKIKNPHFKEEQELRCIHITNKDEYQDIKIRSKGSLLVPYKELIFEPDSIQEIMIGPSVNKGQNKKSLSFMKSQNSYKFDISESDIPYKNW